MPNTTMNKHFNKSPALAKIYELEETDSMSFPLTPSYLYTYLIFIYSRPINLASPLLFPTSLKEYYMQHFTFSSTYQAIVGIHWPGQESSPCALCFLSTKPLQNYKVLSLYVL